MVTFVVKERLTAIEDLRKADAVLVVYADRGSEEDNGPVSGAPAGKGDVTEGGKWSKMLRARKVR